MVWAATNRMFMALFAISQSHLPHPKAHCFGVFALFQRHLLMSIHRPGELVRPADGVKNTLGILMCKYPEYLFCVFHYMHMII